MTEMKSPIFMLVGAGAGDISTTDLTKELLTWTGVSAPRTASGGDARQATPFFKWLLDSAASAYPRAGAEERFGYRPPIGSPNFEELIHLVERLSYLLNEHYYDSPYRRPPPYEVDFYRLSEIGEFLKQHRTWSLYDVVIRASNHILDVVAERAIANPNVEACEVVERFDELFTCKLFSLNYDTRIVRDPNGWWSGFSAMTAEEKGSVHKANDLREVFRREPAIPQQLRAFIQLHGSTHFCWIEDYIAPRYKIARFPRALEKHGTPRRDGFELWNDRSALPVLPMITGFRKGEKTLIEPYLSYLHYLRAEAYRAPNWLIMGYGGGDPHVNAILRSASDYWEQRLRAFVFNYIDESTLEDDALRVTAVKSRVGYLGRNAMTAFARNDGALSNANIVLTTDGAYKRHVERAISFMQQPLLSSG